MEGLKKVLNYISEVRFVVDTDANTVVHQQLLPTVNQPGGLAIPLILWIWLFNIIVNCIGWMMNREPDCVSHYLQVNIQPETKEDDDIADSLEVSIQKRQVEQSSERNREKAIYYWEKRKEAWEHFVGLWQGEEYSARCNPMGKLLGNSGWQEGKTPKHMQHFRWKDINYLTSDEVMYQPEKTSK